MNIEICKRIKQIRKDLNVSQKEFAATIGISQGHLSKIERGEHSPDKPIIMSIAYSYGINPDWLLTGEGEMFRTNDSKNINSGNIINGSNFIIGSNNTGFREKEITDIEKDLIESFRKLPKKKQQYFYHKIKAEALETELKED
ncbi:helix-turn-helix domain-containing protein [Deferribacter autotrophicus]|uniref:Helix-turn-helix domain-containing protein n=1 Tax=Deferribacter autotrophicus TaxID=500465 RepID=A0A5A8F1F9_9BACT|nr:helix-turn-helix transcriptional regulator [Deferribacter autotrophicus]KAA0257186.1 helix-turn-helix domain-containing protein [Deferribacter autotrophicus]